MSRLKCHLVLGYFCVFLQDINYGIEFMIIRFARNVKVGVTANIPEDRIIIWSGFDKLNTWSRNNKQNSKGDKHQVLHLWRNNPLKCRTDNNWLGNIFREGAGATVDDSWTWVNSATLVKKSSIPPGHSERTTFHMMWSNPFILRQLQCWDQFWGKHFRLRKSKRVWQEL